MFLVLRNYNSSLFSLMRDNVRIVILEEKIILLDVKFPLIL